MHRSQISNSYGYSTKYGISLKVNIRHNGQKPIAAILLFNYGYSTKYETSFEVNIRYNGQT